MFWALLRHPVYLYLCFIITSRLFAAEPDTAVVDNQYYTEPVVVTAGKFPILLSESPFKIEVLDKKKIEAANGTSLADILGTTSAVILRSYGTTPLLQTVSINGMGPEHSVVLIDGVRINSFQNSLVDLSLFSRESIERIELISGGASSLYGTNAMGGVINIITNQPGPAEQEVGGKAEYSYGPFEAKKYLLKLNANTQNMQTSFFISNQKSDNRFSYYYDNGVTRIKKERENAAFLLRDMGLSAAYKPGEKSYLKLFAVYTNQDKQLPGIETGTPAPKTLQPDKALNYILTYESVTGESSDIKISINYQNSLQKYQTLPFINSFYKNNLYAAFIQCNYKYEGYKISAGYEGAHGMMNSNELVKTAYRNQHSVFVSSELPLGGAFKLFPSVRTDNYSDLKLNVVTGRLAANIKPFDENLSVRASAGNNFRAPTFNDLYWKISGNPGLRPERSVNADGGIRYFAALQNFQISAEAGYNYVKAEEKIIWVPGAGFLWSPKNISESEARIVSFSLSADKISGGDFTYGASGEMNFNSTKSIKKINNSDPSFNKQLIYIPLTTANIVVMLGYDMLKLNLVFTHLGKRFSDQENKNAMNPVNLLGGNLEVRQSYTGYIAAARIEFNNITDTDYQIISGYPMPLKNFSFHLSLQF